MADITLAVTAAQLNTAGQTAHTHPPAARAFADALTEAPPTQASVSAASTAAAAAVAAASGAVRTVNGVSPDASGNVLVSGGGEAPIGDFIQSDGSVERVLSLTEDTFNQLMGDGELKTNSIYIVADGA